MPFPQQPPINRTPTRVRRLTITLYKSVDPNDTEYPKGVEFEFTVDDQNNNPMNHFHGNLVPHLTTGQKTAIENFFDTMWAKAENEAIP